MTRKTLLAIIVGLAALLLIVFQQGAYAQHEQRHSSGSQMDSSRQRGMMSHEMMQNMQHNRTECQQLNRSADSALTEIRAVRNSKDTKKLQAALSKAEQTLARVRDHTANCMKMMEQMQGSGQMQRGGMMERGGMRDSIRMEHRDMMDTMMERPGMREEMHEMQPDTTIERK